MRILHISSSRYFGGGERHVRDLCSALAERGHDVFVAVSPYSAIRDQLSFLPEDQLFELPFRGPFDLGSARRLAEFARSHRVDILHAHVARDYPVAAIASRLTNVPFVITRHVLFRMSRLHRFLLRGARFVITPSTAVAESLRAQDIFPENKIVTVRHGLRPRAAALREIRSGGDFVVGTIGNLDPVKGFDVLVRAAKIVAERVPNVRFEIAGDDRESDRRNERELRELISTLDLDGRVELTGWSKNIDETIRGFDLFVSSSRSESFGYALADAILAGVPVVATETPGAREVVGETDALVPIGSAPALAERIIYLIRDPDRLAASARRARQHVAEAFAIDRMVVETETIYRRALDSG